MNFKNVRARDKSDSGVVLLWMERATDGTAAGAHLNGTLERLSKAQIRARRTIADTVSTDGEEPVLRKLARLVRLNAVAITTARPGATLIARYHPLMLPAVLAWRIAGGHVVLSVQGALSTAASNRYPRLGRTRLFRLVAVAPAKLAHAIIVGAPPIEEHVRRRMLGRRASLVVIPNGVPVEEIAKARSAPRPMQREYVVFVGNLARWQGIGTLVEAAKNEEWPSDLPLVIVGDGTANGLVKGAKNVIWKGRLSTAESREWLAHSICALSIQRSDVEVASHGYWPFKLIEGAAAGVPMVCSDAEGLPEAANKLGHSLVVPAQDAAATARAVSKLYSDPGLRKELAQAGMRSVHAYDWQAGSEKLAGLVFGGRDYGR